MHKSKKRWVYTYCYI
ncbi:KxYKxGKxW signal peptide domain-containing protein [Borrelia persica]